MLVVVNSLTNNFVPALNLKPLDILKLDKNKIVSIKTDFVTSNGELLISIKHCEKRLHLK